MSTINAISLYSFTDLMDQCLEWKKKYGQWFPTVSVTILRFPSFMSPSLLPTHLKKERKEHLAKWLDKNKKNDLLVEPERDTIQRLIDYLDVIDDPHDKTSDMDLRRVDFKAFHQQYDRRRKKSFAKTFPRELVEWYESIPNYDSGKLEPLLNGDAADDYHDPLELNRLAAREGIKLKKG